eukprot:1196913-Ditylum_brightwellii.AAC.2
MHQNEPNSRSKGEECPAMEYKRPTVEPKPHRDSKKELSLSLDTKVTRTQVSKGDIYAPAEQPDTADKKNEPGQKGNPKERREQKVSTDEPIKIKPKAMLEEPECVAERATERRAKLQIAQEGVQ